MEQEVDNFFQASNILHLKRLHLKQHRQLLLNKIGLISDIQEERKQNFSELRQKLVSQISLQVLGLSAADLRDLYDMNFEALVEQDRKNNPHSSSQRSQANNPSASQRPAPHPRAEQMQLVLPEIGEADTQEMTQQSITLHDQGAANLNQIAPLEGAFRKLLQNNNFKRNALDREHSNQEPLKPQKAKLNLKNQQANAAQKHKPSQWKF